MPDYITLAEAAQLAQLSPVMLRRYAASGQLRARLIGRTYVTTAAAVRQLVKTKRPAHRPTNTGGH